MSSRSFLGLGIVALFHVMSVTVIAAPPQTKAAKPCQPQDGKDVCNASCDAGVKQSCAVLGLMYLRGEIGGTPDHANAERLLRAACEARVPLGCGALGSLFAVQRDYRQSKLYLTKGCDLNDVLSCESLAGQAMGIDGFPPASSDPQAAMRIAVTYHRRACTLGAGDGCAWAAAAIADGLVKGTKKEALDLYVTACNREIATACRKAEELLNSDPATAKQLAEGFDVAKLSTDLLRRACKLGDAKACPRVP